LPFYLENVISQVPHNRPRELVEEGNIEILEPPMLHGMFFNSRISQRDHVAVFIVRSFRQQRVPVPSTQLGDCRTRLFFSRRFS
jgi:hypothetical protein